MLYIDARGLKRINRSACASCKYQRKKCNTDCILAPFFTSGKKNMFKSVHRIFGVRNVQKMIIRLRSRHASENQIKAAMDSVIWQAELWDKQPFEGCYGEFRRLCWEYERLRKLYKRLHSLLNNASEHHQLQHQQVLHHQNLQIHVNQFISTKSEQSPSQRLNKQHAATYCPKLSLVAVGVLMEKITVIIRIFMKSKTHAGCTQPDATPWHCKDLVKRVIGFGGEDKSKGNHSCLE